MTTAQPGTHTAAADAAAVLVTAHPGLSAESVDVTYVRTSDRPP
ncbi:hypothetical protein [Streptomyces mirabilis]